MVYMIPFSAAEDKYLSQLRGQIKKSGRSKKAIISGLSRLTTAILHEEPATERRKIYSDLRREFGLPDSGYKAIVLHSASKSISGRTAANKKAKEIAISRAA